MDLEKIKKSVITYFVIGVLIGVVIIAFVVKTKEESLYQQIEKRVDLYKVTKVIDGDTIKLENDKVVRLIGVDTPELHHPEVPVQVFAEEARDFTRRLCEGFKVYLVYDRQKKGKYGRTLAYVYLENGQMVNEELLKRGYAYVLRRFPFKRKGEFLILQEEARKENRGLWSLNLSPGRLANIATRFNKLSEKGKRQFDKQIDRLLIKYGKDENELK